MVVSGASGTLRASRLKRNKFSEPASALVRGSGVRALVHGSGARFWCTGLVRRRLVHRLD